jgi:2-polyprenyl-3-methyl-5-hydroxy-6-metoxy-1,4-benzoquinol methylase
MGEWKCSLENLVSLDRSMRGESMWEEKDAFHIKGQDDNWWWGKARREIVQQCMEKMITHDMKILEIGAGYGSMTSMLSNFGTVNAIEPYSDAVSYLQEKLQIKTYHGTFESFTEKERYDLITCFDVLEHIEDDRKALSKMATLVNDGGFLVLTVPAYKFLWNKHDEINHHYRRYSKKELLKKIPGNLLVKKVSYFNTLLFPMAIIDKLVLSKNKRSYSFDPNMVVNSILYRIFSAEKTILRFLNLPFGVSILLIAEKRNSRNE